MAKDSGSRIYVEWFNVTYRSVLLAILTAVVVLAGGGAYWYYNYVYSPRAAAISTTATSWQGRPGSRVPRATPICAPS